jgi:levansucrase
MDPRRPRARVAAIDRPPAFTRRALPALIVALALIFSLGVTRTTAQQGVDAASRWTPEQAEQIQLTDANRAPIIERDLVRQLSDEYWLWDWWPVRRPNGNAAEIDGWRIMIALAAPNELTPSKRHDVAQHRYFYSRDGDEWTDGGPVWPDEDVLGSRQWAGSAVWDPDDDTITTFYTVAGEGPRFEPAPEDYWRAGTPAAETEETEAQEAEGEGQVAEEPEAQAAEGEQQSRTPSGYGTAAEGVSYQQRMAAATATVVADDDGVRFEDWSEHRIILEADDELYVDTADTEGGAGNIDAFRDPEFFRDPADGTWYLLFTASLTEENAECPDYNGLVGIARSTSDDLMEWELLPPILSGDCVNRELERPHIVVEDDRYHLFITTHEFTFHPERRGPEGLYGFVADSLRGDYEPLGEGGLVLGNPEEEPYQAYSWLVLPNWWVTGFFQYAGLGSDIGMDEIGEREPAFEAEHFAGTPAPSLYLEVNQDGSTRLRDAWLMGP